MKWYRLRTVWLLTGHIEVDETLILAHFVEDHTLVHG